MCFLGCVGRGAARVAHDILSIAVAQAITHTTQVLVTSEFMFSPSLSIAAMGTVSKEGKKER